MFPMYRQHEVEKVFTIFCNENRYTRNTIYSHFKIELKFTNDKWKKCAHVFLTKIFLNTLVWEKKGIKIKLFTVHVLFVWNNRLFCFQCKITNKCVYVSVVYVLKLAPFEIVLFTQICVGGHLY